MAVLRSFWRVLWLVLRPSTGWENLTGWVDALPYVGLLVAGIARWTEQLGWQGLVAVGLAVAFGLTFHAAWRMQYSLDILSDHEDHAIRKLQESRYLNVGPNRLLNLADILFITPTLWTKPTSAYQFSDEVSLTMFRVDKVQFDGRAVPTDEILPELVLLDILECRMYDPAVGQGAWRQSRDDYPYEIYSYSDFGKKVTRRIRELRDAGKFKVFYDDDEIKQ